MDLAMIASPHSASLLATAPRANPLRTAIGIENIVNIRAQS